MPLIIMAEQALVVRGEVLDWLVVVCSSSSSTATTATAGKGE